VEVVTDGLGQPGHRELLLVAHDIDARRDLVFALLDPARREGSFDGLVGNRDRRFDLVDLGGAGRRHAFDAMAAALCVPVLADPHVVHFARESVWRGETHRLHDRPAATARLIEEVSAIGVEQVVVVSAVAPGGTAHGLRRLRTDPRGWMGEVLTAAEGASTRDAVTALFDRFSAVFQIHPEHNPLGPFEFGGTYDAASDRVVHVAELIDRGYEDAYRQFIEPVVGGTDEPDDGAAATEPPESGAEAPGGEPLW